MWGLGHSGSEPFINLILILLFKGHFVHYIFIFWTLHQFTASKVITGVCFTVFFRSTTQIHTEW